MARIPQILKMSLPGPRLGTSRVHARACVCVVGVRDPRWAWFVKSEFGCHGQIGWSCNAAHIVGVALERCTVTLTASQSAWLLFSRVSRFSSSPQSEFAFICISLPVQIIFVCQIYPLLRVSRRRKCWLGCIFTWAKCKGSLWSVDTVPYAR